MHGPHGAAFDARGRLYVTDTFNHRVQVWDVAGLARGRRPRLIRYFGNFGRDAGDFRAPQAAAAFSPLPALAGRAFVADARNERVQEFDARGAATGKVLGGPGTEDGRLDGLAGIAFDPRGRVLYAAESGNRRVSAFDAVTGGFLGAFARDLTSAGGIAVDAAGVVYVTDVGAGLVRRYRPARTAAGLVRDAAPLGAWGRKGTGPGQWIYPQSIAVDGRGRVYVTDLADDRGQVFTPAGRLLGTFGEDVEPGPALDEPAAPALPRAICSNGRTFAVRVGKAPDAVPLGALVELEVAVFDGCAPGAGPLDKADLRVDAMMPAHAHGMNTQPRASPLGGGRFAVTGLRFHMPGLWELYFDVVRGKVLERAQAPVTVE
jgi:sugar lactone lactonase YvrE